MAFFKKYSTLGLSYDSVTTGTLHSADELSLLPSTHIRWLSCQLQGVSALCGRLWASVLIPGHTHRHTHAYRHNIKIQSILKKKYPTLEVNICIIFEIS